MDALVRDRGRGTACTVDRGRRARASARRYRGRPLGGDRRLGALSFHETKNVICGEGGALLINDRALVERAEILREKGTDRAPLLPRRGRQVHVGRPRLLVPAQRDQRRLPVGAARVAPTRSRRRGWRSGTPTTRRSRGSRREGLAAAAGRARRTARHNAHLYYLLLPDGGDPRRADRDAAARGHRRRLPLRAAAHVRRPAAASAGARRAARHRGRSSDRLVRLPLWVGMERGRSRAASARRPSTWPAAAARPALAARVPLEGLIVVPVYNSARRRCRELCDRHRGGARRAASSRSSSSTTAARDGSWASDRGARRARTRACAGSTWCETTASTTPSSRGIRAARDEVIVTSTTTSRTRPRRSRSCSRKLDEGYDVVYGTPEQQQHGLLARISPHA